MKTLTKISFVFLLSLLASCTAMQEVAEKETADLKSELPSETSVNSNQELSESEKKYTLEDEDDIPWYALENENNEAYWANVNCNKVWIEFKSGVSLESEEVKDFLNSFNLTDVDRKSMNPEATNYVIFNLPNGDKKKVLEIVNAAKEKNFILFAEPQNSYSNNFEPNDTFWNQQWGPYVIYADEAWDEVSGNSLNVIAVVDDAVDYTHEDLADQVQYGWDYGFNDADPAPDVADQSHGTHVTGTIAATIDNGVGIAGMVNDTVFFAKVTDATYDPSVGNFSDAAIVDALYDIADIPRVGVINLSLGGPTPSAAMEAACNYAWNQGKVICAASGNDGTAVIGFPAAFESCIAIGALGTDGDNFYLADYSQFGVQQEVVAPGGDLNTGFGILSTLPGNDYGFLQGTSMATPHVTGLIGLIQAYDPTLNNLEVREILQTSCLDLGEGGWDQVFGFGLINASNALALVDNGGVSISEVSRDMVYGVFPNPTSDNFQVTRLENTKEVTVNLIALDGRVLETKTFFEGMTNLNWEAGDLPSGIYLLQFGSNRGEIKTQKISIN